MRPALADYDYFRARGLRSAAPDRLNASLRTVLDAMPTVLYGEPAGELTPEEQQALIEGGVRVESVPNGDPLAATAVQYAALIETSLSRRPPDSVWGFPKTGSAR